MKDRKQTTLDGQPPREAGGFSEFQRALPGFSPPGYILDCSHRNVEARSNSMKVYAKPDGTGRAHISDYVQTRHYCLDCGRLVSLSTYNRRLNR